MFTLLPSASGHFGTNCCGEQTMNAMLDNGKMQQFSQILSDAIKKKEAYPEISTYIIICERFLK